MDNFKNPLYRKVFFEDTDKIISGFKNDLLSLKSKERQKEALKNIHRYAHSLKGLSAAMGLEEIRVISDNLEESLKRLLDVDSLDIDKDKLKEIENGFKNIEELLHHIKNIPQ